VAALCLRRRCRSGIRLHALPALPPYLAISAQRHRFCPAGATFVHVATAAVVRTTTTRHCAHALHADVGSTETFGAGSVSPAQTRRPGSGTLVCCCTTITPPRANWSWCVPKGATRHSASNSTTTNRHHACFIQALGWLLHPALSVFYLKRTDDTLLHRLLAVYHYTWYFPFSFKRPDH
jgi:hypothetical protein